MYYHRQLQEKGNQVLLEFNGKQVVMACTRGHEGYGDDYDGYDEYNESHTWVVGYANSFIEITVNEPGYYTQFEYVQQALQSIDSSADDAEESKQDLINQFSNDWWDELGFWDLAYSHALKLVGYNEANRAEDVLAVTELTAELAEKHEVVQKLSSELKEPQEAFSGVTKLLSGLNTFVGEAKEISEKVEAIEYRMSVDAQRAEDGLLHDRWSNKSFFEKYGDLPEAETVRVILKEAGVKI
jgi:hypothetical protein